MNAGAVAGAGVAEVGEGVGAVVGAAADGLAMGGADGVTLTASPADVRGVGTPAGVLQPASVPSSSAPVVKDSNVGRRGGPPMNKGARRKIIAKP